MVDNAGTGSAGEKIGIEIEVEQIAPGAGCTDAGTKLDAVGIEMGGTEAEYVERRVIAADTGFALESAVVTSATSAAPTAASVVAQVAAVRPFVGSASVVRSVAALAFPAAASPLAFAFPMPSAAVAAVRVAAAQHVVVLTAAGEFASAVPTTVVVPVAVDIDAAVAAESAAVVAGASAAAAVFVEATAAETGTALVAADS